MALSGPAGWAEVGDGTLGAERFSGWAQGPAMIDQQIIKIQPVTLRDYLQEILFDLIWIRVLTQTHSSRKALDMGVHCNPFRLIITTG